MITIRDYVPSFFRNFPPKPGNREYFQLHIDEYINSYQKGIQKVADQVKSVSAGSYGFIHPSSYPDMSTGQPITSFQPLFPNEGFIGSQVKEVSYDAQMEPHSVPYPDVTTGTPVGKFNFVTNPPQVGKNLNVTV